MITDLAAGVFMIAVIYVMVRPGSHGVDFINAFSSALTATIRQATDIANQPDDGSGDTQN